jgi:hypothetical protein
MVSVSISILRWMNEVLPLQNRLVSSYPKSSTQSFMLVATYSRMEASSNFTIIVGRQLVLVLLGFGLVLCPVATDGGNLCNR